MSTAILPPWDIGELPPMPVRRFTVDEYQRLGELGFLTPEDRVELLEGWIVQKMTNNPSHAATIELIDEALRPLLPVDLRMRFQLPITTIDSAPEPDVAIVRGGPRDRARRHPRPDDVVLIIEVAESSLERGRGPKGRLYARAAIPVYWIVNLIDRRIEVHTNPTGPTDEPKFQQTITYGPDDDLPVLVEGIQLTHLNVAELLP